MERFDILDGGGRPTGRTADKGAPLAAGEYYLGVHALVHNARGEFLLQRRTLNKAFRPGGWDIHLGHVMAGETSCEAMARELWEEIGLRCAQGALRLVGRVVWPAHHHLSDLYILRAEFNEASLRMQPDEVMALGRVGRGEMVALVAAMDWRPPAWREMALAAVRDAR